MKGTQSLDRALTIFKHVLSSHDQDSAIKIASDLDLPLATVYRHIGALERHGFIRRIPGGRLAHGSILLQFVHPTGFKHVLKKLALPTIDLLSNEVQQIIHLGVFEDDMVTYIVKANHADKEIFTREDEQLEAYCSGIGKVLLAFLPQSITNEYLSSSPFPALTDTTITNPKILKETFKKIRKNGFAIDNGEMDSELYCVAVPVFNKNGDILAALSTSTHTGKLAPREQKKIVMKLKAAALQITQSL